MPICAKIGTLKASRYPERVKWKGKGMIDTILVDLDGTVARGNLDILLPLYNDYFKLSLSEERLHAIQSMEEFEQLAEVQDFRANMGEFRYNLLIQIADCAPRHLSQAHVIQGAREGVERLAELGANSLGYCTARKSDSEQWNRGMAEATYTWLNQQNFPSADQVLFCDGPGGKLQTIAAQLRKDHQSTLLIDDQYQALLAAIPSLAEEDQALLEQFLTLGAYHAQNLPERHSSMRILPLQQWDDIDQFICLL